LIKIINRGQLMKKMVALFLAFALTVPVYVTHLVNAVETESILEYASERLAHFESEPVPIPSLFMEAERMYYGSMLMSQMSAL